MFWRQNPQYVIDIGSRQLKAVQARYVGRSRLRILEHHLIDSPPACPFPLDPGVNLVVAPAFDQAVSQLVHSCGITPSYVGLLCPDFVFQTRMQASPAAEESPDWLTQACPPGKIKNQTLSLVAKIRRQTVLEVGATFQRHGAYPVVVDIALLNAVGVFHDYLVDLENDGRNIAVLNLGHVASSMAIFRDGNLAAARARRTDGDADGPLLAGGNAFTQHIMSHRSLNSTDAERYKREQLFFLPEFAPEQEGISNYQMIKPAFRELVQGIFDVIEGYLVKFQEPRVDEIILTGGGANFQNLDVALAGQLKTRVIKGSSLISMVNPAGQELPEDLKNVLTPAVGGFCREN